DLLRILHTLKGGARLAGQTHIGTLSHELEQRLIEARQKGEPAAHELYELVRGEFATLQAAVDGLRGLLNEEDLVPVEAPAPASPAVSEERQAVATVAPASAPEAPATQVLPFVRQAQEAREAAARRAPQELVKVPAELLDELVNLAGETSIF